MTYRRLGWFAVAAAIAAGVIAARASGLTHLDAETLAADIRSTGALGPAVVLLAFVVQCILAPLPSEPVMLASGFVYGPGGGFALSWLGVVAGACACFGLSRRFGRPLAERFVGRHYLDAVDTYVEGRGTRSLFLLLVAIRTLAFTSFDATSYGCGLTRFPFRWFVLATALGVIPKAFAFSYAGATATSRPGWIDAVILVGSFGVVFAVPFLVGRRRGS